VETEWRGAGRADTIGAGGDPAARLTR